MPKHTDHWVGWIWFSCDEIIYNKRKIYIIEIKQLITELGDQIGMGMSLKSSELDNALPYKLHVADLK